MKKIAIVLAGLMMLVTYGCSSDQAKKAAVEATDKAAEMTKDAAAATKEGAAEVDEKAAAMNK